MGVARKKAFLPGMRRAIALAFMLLLASCGGSSGGSGAPGEQVLHYDLRAVPEQTPQHVLVSWDDSHDEVEHYELYLAREPLDDLAHYASYQGGELIQDAQSPYTTQLSPGTWYFRVAAYSEDGRLPASHQVSLFVPVGGLNDTGITLCADLERYDHDCEHESVAGFPGQDARTGRDADGGLIKIGAGDAGFDYTRICRSGELAGEGNCPPDPVRGSADNEWGCTRDNVTGLIWEVKTPDPDDLHSEGGVFTWFRSDPSHPEGGHGDVNEGGSCPELDQCNTEAFIEAVNDNGLCGANDWRLPTPNELVGILHLGKPTPFIDSQGFENAPFFFWSATPDTAETDLPALWEVGFMSGSVESARHDTPYYYRARLVRSPDEPAPTCPGVPSSDFEIHHDTVTHIPTGLMWPRCPEGTEINASADACEMRDGEEGRYTWQAALQHAEGHAFAGYDDWRVPNHKELLSIVEYCSADVRLNPDAFPSFAALTLSDDARFWTSSPRRSWFFSGTESSWTVNFDGSLFNSASRRTSEQFLRLVRDAE